MTANPLRVIVTGYIAQYPLGGVTWDYLQYVVGLADLGHEVYYVEDTGQWPYNPDEGGVSNDCQYNVEHVARVMSRFGLGDCWAYCFPWQDQWFGMEKSIREEVFATCDAILNVSGCWRDPSAHEGRGRLAFIDTDPVFTQLKLARGQEDFIRAVDAHDVHFTFGEALDKAQDDGLVPETGHRWHPTRQPIVLEEWEVTEEHRDRYTTVMNWTSYRGIDYGGRTYGQKDVEFLRFLDLPERVAPIELEIAVAEGKTHRPPRELQRHRGWNVVNPDVVCPDLDSYRDYLRSSKGEWSVAKNGYVEGRPGWFSCRSACYLASGRPVVVQDTGFDGVLPAGEGLIAFSDLEEAADGLQRVEGHYQRHSRAARDIAVEYFDSRRVLPRLLDEVDRSGNRLEIA